MVERAPSGVLHPYVMDFGLAREVNATGPSRASALEGTPRYMAPEQARGDTRHLDRRTDVYSLGVTLYELLAGQPPFKGDSEVDILLAVLLEEPTPLRVCDKDLPADLEAITHKCLEKEPAARYDSAKALAEDLGRYLNGEPVLARRVSLLERGYRQARRHKVATASIALAMTVVLALSTVMVRAQLRAARDFERAEELGQDIKELELFLRFASSLPLHDVGREQAVIRKRMDEMAAQFGGRRGQAAALVEYALGRGFLALGEPERARERLIAGLQLGHRSPDAHYALGRALGELYQRGLDQTRFAGTPGWQAQQREKLRRELLTPALHELAQGQGQRLEPTSFAQGVLAYQSGRYKEAMDHARQTLEQAPWLYEADLLIADCLRALGEAAHLAGKHKESIELYEKAAAHYRAAREVGRSDPQVHTREAQLWIQRIEVEADAGHEPTAAGEQAIAASERAIATQTAGLWGYQAKANSLMRILHHKQAYGQDPGHLPEEILELARRILRFDPDNAMASYFVAVTQIIKFTFAMEHGHSGAEFFDESIRYYKRTLELKPDYSRAYNDLGCAYGLRAQWLGLHGEPFAPHFADSLRYLRRAIAEDAEDVYPKYNLCDIGARYMRLQLMVGRGDFALLAEARELERWFARQNRRDYSLYSYIGQAMIPKIAHDVAQGQPLEADVAEALGYFGKSLAENPQFPETERGRAEVFALQSLDALLGQRDATASLEAGLAAAQRASELNPLDAATHLLRARLLLYRSRTVQGAAQQAALGAGETAARRALELDGESAEGRIVLAQLLGGRGAVDQGLAMAAAALQINPRQAEALATRAALLLLGATGSAPAPEPAARREQARAALTQALAINPLLQREYAPLGKALRVLPAPAPPG